jgi:hypothetical protein
MRVWTRTECEPFPPPVPWQSMPWLEWRRRFGPFGRPCRGCLRGLQFSLAGSAAERPIRHRLLWPKNVDARREEASRLRRRCPHSHRAPDFRPGRRCPHQRAIRFRLRSPYRRRHRESESLRSLQPARARLASRLRAQPARARRASGGASRRACDRHRTRSKQPARPLVLRARSYRKRGRRGRKWRFHPCGCAARRKGAPNRRCS